eukprot:PhF_6_TR41305/c1_g1_i1/m.62539/K02218/CSNK1, CKI; casein kinase 1
MDLRVGKRFRIGKRLGSGSFGEIYQGLDCVTLEPVAIKLEKISSPLPQLAVEKKIYSLLHADGEVEGFARVYHYGVEGEFNVLVMDMLGPCLEDLFNYCGRKLSVKTCVLLTDQMIRRCEHFHKCNLIHRDIKPDNFLMGGVKRSIVLHMIDFGLSKRYRHPTTHQHIEFKTDKSMTGTARYASLNAHKGYELSRRDDLESIAYVMIYFMAGKLPWQGLKPTKEQKEKETDKYEHIAQVKEETSLDVLCQGLPQEVLLLMQYVKGLQFEEDPNYGYIRGLLKDLGTQHNVVNDGLYDWTLKRAQERKERRNKAESVTSGDAS